MPQENTIYIEKTSKLEDLSTPGQGIKASRDFVKCAKHHDAP